MFYAAAVGAGIIGLGVVFAAGVVVGAMGHALWWDRKYDVR